MEKFRVEHHNEVTSQGIHLKEHAAKTCEFIDIITASQMQEEALAKEVHTHAQIINEYENGKLTVEQQKIIIVLMDQRNTMNIAMNSMQKVVKQSFHPPQNAPLLAIRNTPMDDSEDTPASVTGSRSIQIDKDDTLNKVIAAKKPIIPNKNKPKQT